MRMSVPVVVPAVVAMLDMFLMRRAAVDVEFHAFDVLPLCPVMVHVEIADVQLAQLPFERAGFHAEIDECTDHHVATDAGDAVEEESFHVRENCRVLRGCKQRTPPRYFVAESSAAFTTGRLSVLS